MVVDREVQVLPAGVAAAGATPSPRIALADRPEAAELLDVDVHELARPRALVADDRARAPAAAAARRRGGAAPSRPSRPAARAARRRSAAPPCAYSRASRIRCSSSGEQPPRLPSWHRRPITQRRPTALLVAPPEPIAGRTARAAGGRGRLRAHPLEDQRDKPAARLERETHPPGGQTRSCIWASCASWVLVDHKARRRPGRDQPSRRCVGNRARPRRRACGVDDPRAGERLGRLRRRPSPATR